MNEEDYVESCVMRFGMGLSFVREEERKGLYAAVARAVVGGWVGGKRE